MSEPDLAAYKAAALSLNDDELTNDGVPKMDPLNAALSEAGFSAIKAARRDEFEAMIDAEQAAEEVAEAAPVAGWVTIKLTEALAEPLPLYVHGIGRFELRVGKAATIPEEALATLNNVSGAAYVLED